MKQHLLTLLLCISTSLLHAGNSGADGNSSFTIDVNDTLVFDISQSVMAGNQVSFPVYLLSDDTINAVDFSFSYDETNFSLDTIINLTAYLQPLYNYTMGTLYFTSNSLQSIEHAVPLVSVRFNMLGHYLCSDDLNSLLVYLNGDACSVKVVECLSDHVSPDDQINDNLFVYSNPSDGNLNIESAENASAQVFDLKGAAVTPPMEVMANQKLIMNTSAIVPGIYFVKIFNGSFVATRKIAVSR
jgi:hypothetical protein